MKTQSENSQPLALWRPNENQLRFLINEMGIPTLRLALTKDCNADCSFCHNEGQRIGARGPTARPVSAQLRPQDYAYIAKFFRSHFSAVKLTGGEPTLVKPEDLAVITSIFAKTGYEVSMVTNGFGLTYELQLRLRAAGMTRVNVSLHSLDPLEHAEAFGVSGQLPRVLENLQSLNSVFPGNAKINFMALPGQNIPQRLIPITELSATSGLQVSLLSPVAERSFDHPLTTRIMDYLRTHIGIGETKIVVRASRTRRIFKLHNGGVVEIDDFRCTDHRDTAFNNAICRNCPKRGNCVEGPYAARILHDGTFRPCLIRGDNVARFVSGSYDLEARK